MRILEGLAVSPGLAIGNVVLKKEKLFKIEKQNIHENLKQSEINLLRESLDRVVEQIWDLIESGDSTKEDKEILEVHMEILKDQSLFSNIITLILDESITKEHAVYKHFKVLIEHFENIQNDYFSQRASDYKDVAARLLSNLLGEDTNYFENITDQSIIITPDISPSFVSALSKIPIKAICLEKGSRTSHSSIIARAVQLPTIVKIPNLSEYLNDGDLVIVDGFIGKIYIQPDQKTIKLFEKKIIEESNHDEKLLIIRDLPSKTKDGVKIDISSNIEFPEEVDKVLEFNSDGVGLFRSEFLYLKSTDLPSEQVQVEVYSEIAKRVFPNELTIRTIDIGGDKLSNVLSVGGLSEETNPYLGCRGIRLSLKFPNLLRTQLQAIIRANTLGNIRIMFPMISDIHEIHKAKVILEESKKYLRSKKIKFNKNLKVGAMIEIPSAALSSDVLAKECDFFSLGTNDLIQYTLAVDRNSDDVSSYFDSYHPSVWKLIKMTVENAKKANIPISVCGEMASELDFVPLLIGIGVKNLSVNPASVLTIKEKILNISYEKAKELAEQIFKYETSDEIKFVIMKWREKYDI